MRKRRDQDYNRCDHLLRTSRKENAMFDITEKATEMIKEFLKDKDENAAIRFIVSGGG